MTFNVILWMFTMLFVATMFNVVTAYTSMKSTDIHQKFQQIELIN